MHIQYLTKEAVEAKKIDHSNKNTNMTYDLQVKYLKDDRTFSSLISR
jgi:hypothetical protein